MASGLKKVQLLEGLVVRAIESALVADQQGEGLSAVGEPLKDPGQAIVIVYIAIHLIEGLLDVPGMAQHFVGQKVGFDGTDAAQAPAGDGHGLDQLHFDAGLGIELVLVGIEEKLEVFGGLVGENYVRKRDARRLGREPVTRAVAGRPGPALRRDWAAGFGAVGAGGVAFTLRWHFSLRDESSVRGAMGRTGREWKWTDLRGIGQ